MDNTGRGILALLTGYGKGGVAKQARDAASAQKQQQFELDSAYKTAQTNTAAAREQAYAQGIGDRNDYWDTTAGNNRDKAFQTIKSNYEKALGLGNLTPEQYNNSLLSLGANYGQDVSPHLLDTARPESYIGRVPSARANALDVGSQTKQTKPFLDIQKAVSEGRMDPGTALNTMRSMNDSTGVNFPIRTRPRNFGFDANGQQVLDYAASHKADGFEIGGKKFRTADYIDPVTGQRPATLDVPLGPAAIARVKLQGAQSRAADAGTAYTAGPKTLNTQANTSYTAGPKTLNTQANTGYTTAKTAEVHPNAVSNRIYQSLMGQAATTNSAAGVTKAQAAALQADTAQRKFEHSTSGALTPQSYAALSKEKAAYLKEVADLTYANSLPEGTMDANGVPISLPANVKQLNEERIGNLRARNEQIDRLLNAAMNDQPTLNGTAPVTVPKAMGSMQLPAQGRGHRRFAPPASLGPLPPLPVSQGMLPPGAPKLPRIPSAAAAKGRTGRTRSGRTRSGITYTVR